MNESQQQLFERQLVSLSRGLEYPRTPDIAGAVVGRLSGAARPRSRRLALSLAVLLVLFSSLMLIPPARAAILEFIQIGVVRIFRAEPTPAPEGAPQQQFPSTMAPVTATPVVDSHPLNPILRDLAGEMTLEEAQQTLSYALQLPTYPEDLGRPDYTFVQDADGDMTILVWTDPEQPDEVSMSLHFLPPDSWAIKKIEPALVQETTVNGQRAIWAVGPYPIKYANGSMDIVRMVRGHVLIWTEGDLTYRLETELSLDEAVKVAESLEPIR